MVLGRRRTVDLLYFILTEGEGIVAPRAEGLATRPPRPLRQRKGPGRPRHPTPTSRQVPISGMNIAGSMIDALRLQTVAAPDHVRVPHVRIIDLVQRAVVVVVDAVH